ncbi:MAG: glycosyltransferase family 9 protein, partial [Deltaproteobacteria bacterium]|nr:glycosyltransferase family 9 protein [Deltaproteobacteria bacterium]
MGINIAMQRRIDRIIGSVICGLLSLLAILKRPVCFNQKPSGILVLLLSEMGSIVLARPMFDRLREKYPNASIYVLCFERNREFLELINVIQPGHIFTVREDDLLCLLKDSISA